MTATVNMIEVNGVSKQFKDFWGRPKVSALESVTLNIPQGTIYGLLGPNGAGKSTLIKLILGHLYPTAGTIAVIGKSPRDVDTKKRIGYLPERTSFYPNLTAQETLTFFGRLLGLADAETKRRSQQLLRMVGLEHTGSRLVGEFSHGMRKRLGLSQALLNDPDLLLLDEPTAGLDPIGCREIKDLILTLGRRGKTVLMTSHLLGDVQDVSDRIMIIYGGRVQSEGRVDELLAKRDKTQIVTQAVESGKLDKINEILKDGEPNRTVEVSNPTRTLEDYFLEVVATAKQEGKGVSGAEMGEGVADYLKQGDDSAAKVLAEVTKPEPAPEPAPEAPVEQPETSRLNQLNKAEPEDQSEKQPDTEQPDRDVLDALTKK